MWTNSGTFFVVVYVTEQKNIKDQYRFGDNMKVQTNLTYTPVLK